MYSYLKLSLAITAGFALGACAPQADLEPAPQANPVAGRGEGAAATEAGVRVVARTDAWSATPENLGTQVTPILVEVENNSDVPLRLRYDAFQLMGSQRTFAAIPPFLVGGEVTQPVTTPYYTGTGFTVAEYLSPYYPGVPTFADPSFAYDPLYYDTYYPQFRDIDLPTEDMLQRALPEGVLDPQGRTAGFLYFENVGAEGDVNRVSFQAELINARTGEQFGTITIPFTTA